MYVCVCENFVNEVKEVLKELDAHSVSVVSFPSTCGKPPLVSNQLKELFDTDEPAVILGGACLANLRNILESRENTIVKVFDNCFNILMESGVYNFLIRDGAYLLTPGWLANWENHVDKWNFKHDDLCSFFAESCKYLLLLDTAVSQESCRKFDDFAKAVNRPAESIEVSLSLLKSFLSDSMQKLTANKKSFTDAETLADYAMAMELTHRLAGMLSEKAVIENIIETFNMLFAPEEMFYLKIRNSRPVKLYSKSALPLDDPMITSQLMNIDKSFKWLPSGKGFLIQICFNNSLLGVLCIEGIAFPEHKDRYLNLALFVSEVCGLSISNAIRHEYIEEQVKRVNFANEELGRREEYFRSLYEVAPVAYISLDVNGCLINANQAWLDMLGYKELEVIGQWLGNYMQDNTVSSYQKVFSVLLESGRIDQTEFDMCKKNGSVVTVSFSGKVLKDFSGKILRTHCIFNDITKQKKLLETLENEAFGKTEMEGIISICAGCNKIKDDKVLDISWVAPSEYFSSRYPDLQFSHGICTECLAKFYPDFDRKK